MRIPNPTQISADPRGPAVLLVILVGVLALLFACGGGAGTSGPTTIALSQSQPPPQ